MQPFEILRLTKVSPTTVTADVHRRNELVVRFLTDSAQYLGLDLPMSEKPERNFRHLFFNHFIK